MTAFAGAGGGGIATTTISLSILGDATVVVPHVGSGMLELSSSSTAGVSVPFAVVVWVTLAETVGGVAST